MERSTVSKVTSNKTFWLTVMSFVKNNGIFSDNENSLIGNAKTVNDEKQNIETLSQDCRLNVISTLS